MSVIMKVEIFIDDSQIQGLYQLYLYSIDYKKPTKKSFIDYARNQIMFGNGDFLLGTGADDGHYPELLSDDLDLLMKWGLL